MFVVTSTIWKFQPVALTKLPIGNECKEIDKIQMLNDEGAHMTND